VKSKEDDGGNRDGLDESLLIPLRRDDDDEDDDGIGGGGGIGGPPIGNNDDRKGDEPVGVGPNGGRRSVLVDMNRFRSSFRENDGR